jgi:hypothetical protein
MVNTNILHNVLNVMIALISALATFDWTPFMSEGTALKVTGVLALSKLVINAFRDGISGLAKDQPPVQ